MVYLKACKQKKYVGPCKESIKKWFYNKRTGKCKKFYWGGCDPNDNNFPSKKECKETCRKRGIIQNMFKGNKFMVAISVTNHGIILYSILPYFHSVKLRDAKRKAYYVALDGTMIMEPVAKD